MTGAKKNLESSRAMNPAGQKKPVGFNSAKIVAKQKNRLALNSVKIVKINFGMGFFRQFGQFGGVGFQ